MSGGVDSAAAAILLKRDGFDVTGVTFFFNGTNAEANDFLTYADGSASAKAKEVTSALGIPHLAIDKRSEFRACVTERFVSDYACGKTPNPCVICNRHVKIRCLIELADELGCDFIATGHYAVPVTLENGRSSVKKATDTKKDQSYMLYRLTQEMLSRLILPLGGYTKPEIRKIVTDAGFTSCGSAADSQDICFIPDGDYVNFIERTTGEHFARGNFIDKQGNILGTHEGIIKYTIGQRKGLGLALGEPMYVCAKSIEKNTVTLAKNEELFARELTAHQINLISCDSIPSPIKIKAKIRYNQKEQPATAVQIVPDKIKIIFDEPQRAITSGQSVVMYDGDIVVGGGIIE